MSNKLETISITDLDAVTGGALWMKKGGKLVKIPHSDVPPGAEDLLGPLRKALSHAQELGRGNGGIVPKL